jgi:hypothetical protein
MSRTLPGLVALALAAALAGCGGGDGGVGKGPVVRASVEIQLQEENGSGESGLARLVRITADKTQVAIAMQSGPPAAQPVHIHAGSCGKLDPTPAYPLNDIVGGKSTTVVAVSLDALEKKAYAINVHKSALDKDLSTYVACGNIGENSAPAQTVTSSDED